MVTVTSPYRRRVESITTKNKRIMKEKIKNWMGKTNMLFTSIAGERVTNAEVLYTHIGMVIFLLTIGIVGNLSNDLRP